MIVALIPAHNEEAVLANAINGLKHQTFDVDRCIVIADNCTDSTISVALGNRAEVWETKNNTHKKAGALNQVLRVLIDALDDEDYILVTDADSVLDPGFLAAAIPPLEELAYGRHTPTFKYGGVCGVFRGQPGGGIVGHLQRNEYARYARDVRRLKGRCLVLTGTAAVFPVRVLREVRDARLNGNLPAGDGQGGIYDTTVLTEDNELSFAIMHLGYKIFSPKGCTLTTEVMPTWGDLWKQRLRWKRGAIENCVQYGLTKVTARYWGRQLFTMLGVLVSTLYLFTLVWFGATGGLHIAPIWIGLTGVFMVERVVTVKDRGWKEMLGAFFMWELPYDYFLQACSGKAYVDSLLRRKKEW